MKLEDFVGNFSKVEELVNWLNEFFHKKTEDTKRYAVLFGNSGNGKTLVPKLLAKSFDTELFAVNSIDIKEKNDLFNIIKSANLRSFSHSQKILLIDDIQEFQVTYRNKLLNLKSVYPIIYTCETGAHFEKEFKDDALMVKLKKQITSLLTKHLLKKARKMEIEIPKDVVYDIAKNSKSVRSAELSLYTALTNNLSNPYETHIEVLASIKKRNLKQPITRLNKHWIFNSIKGYDAKTLSVMERFAKFDYRIKVQYEEIEPYFVNNMIEPIEEIVLKEQYFSKNSKEKQKVKKEKEEVKKEVTSLSKWGI